MDSLWEWAQRPQPTRPELVEHKTVLPVVSVQKVFPWEGKKYGKLIKCEVEYRDSLPFFAKELAGDIQILFWTVVPGGYKFDYRERI